MSCMSKSEVAKTTKPMHQMMHQHCTHWTNQSQRRSDHRRITCWLRDACTFHPTTDPRFRETLVHSHLPIVIVAHMDHLINQSLCDCWICKSRLTILVIEVDGGPAGDQPRPQVQF